MWTQEYARESMMIWLLPFGQISVAMAQANIFAILGNKIIKNLKIFVEVDYLRSWGVLCQP